MVKRDWVENYFSSKSMSVSFDSSNPEILVVIDEQENKDDKKTRWATRWVIPANKTGEVVGVPELEECLVERNNSVKEIDTIPYSHMKMAEKVAKKLGFRI